MSLIAPEGICRFLSAEGRCTFKEVYPEGTAPDGSVGGMCKVAQASLLKLPSRDVSNEGLSEVVKLIAQEQGDCNQYRGSGLNHKSILQTLQLAYLDPQIPFYARNLYLSESVFSHWKVTAMPIGKRLIQAPNVDTMAYKALSEIQDQFGGYRSMNSSPLSEYILNQFRRGRFNGTQSNYRFTIMPPDTSFVPNRDNISPESVFTFLTDVDLHSTGRPNYGTFVTETSLYHRDSGKLGHLVGMSHRVIKGKQGWDILKALIDSSSASWQISQIEALQNVASAGLPTLGKKR